MDQLKIDFNTMAMCLGGEVVCMSRGCLNRLKAIDGLCSDEHYCEECRKEDEATTRDRELSYNQIIS